MEEFDEKYLWPVLKWIYERRSYFITFIIGLVVLLYMRHEWWQVVETNRNLILERATHKFDETKALEQLAFQGDAFGSVNAWFSGVAMLAAILAIVFQAFEFGHQREEFAKATQAHIDRLEFDEYVFLHNRKMVIIEFVRRIHSAEIQKIITTLRVRMRAEPNEIGLKEAYILTYDSTRYALATADFSSTRAQSAIAAVTEIEGSAPLFNLLLEVDMFQPDDPEIHFIVPIVHETGYLIEEMFNATKALPKSHWPLWISSAERIRRLVVEDISARQ